MIYLLFLLGSIVFSLYFGEAKQGTIELVWATLAIVFFFLSYLVPKKYRASFFVPNAYSLLFIILFISLTVSTVYSSSIAYSVSFLLRVLTTWCLFSLLYSIPNKKSVLPMYAKSLVYIGGGVALISIAFRFFPHLIKLPSMNLLFSQGGHNHAVNLLITIFPIAFHYAIQHKNTVVRWGVLFLFPLAIMFCFSRGAVLLICIYLLLLNKQHHAKQPTHMRRWTYPIIVAFVGMLFLMIYASFIVPTNDFAKKVPFKIEQITKSRLSEEVRLSNWNQAIRGFISHPILGTGPNTYILTSMQYHKKTNDGTGLAHNWYLQTLSEVGLLGALPIGYVLYRLLKTFWNIRKTVKKNSKNAWVIIGLVDSVFIACSYSLIDYNLDYFTLWILLWGTVAILLPTPKKSTSAFLSRSITIGAIALLGAYVGTNLYANTKLTTVETVSQRFLLQPYDTNKTARCIEYKNIQGQPLTDKEQAIILLWHKQNPDVLITLANAQRSMAPEKRNEYYKSALARNPLNSYYYQSYLMFLYEHQQKESMYDVFATFIDNAYHITIPSSPSITSKLPHDTILSALNPDIFALFSGTANVPEIASKMLYIIGLSSLSTDPTTTENLWTLAKDISPDWGLFHRELASYYLYVAQEALQAKLTLIDCQMHSSPAKACRDDVKLLPHIPEPGSYKENILLIPIY